MKQKNSSKHHHTFNEEYIQVDAWSHQVDDYFSTDLLRVLQKKITLPMVDQRNQAKKKSSQYTEICDDQQRNHHIFSRSIEGKSTEKKLISNQLQVKDRIIRQNPIKSEDNKHPFVRSHHLTQFQQKIVYNNKCENSQTKQMPSKKSTENKSASNLVNMQYMKKKKQYHTQENEQNNLEQVWLSCKKRIKEVLTLRCNKLKEKEKSGNAYLKSHQRAVSSASYIPKFSLEKNRLKKLEQKKINLNPYRIGIKEKMKETRKKEKKIGEQPSSDLNRIPNQVSSYQKFPKSDSIAFADGHLQLIQ